jgi:thiosulfate/3-mercaptopyruvate sulfurtransferase
VNEAELAQRLAEGTVGLIDVRTPAEYAGETGYPCDPRQGHIPGAVNIEWEALYAGAGQPLPADEVKQLLADRGVDPATPLVVYCHTGQRSEFAAHALRAAGLSVENYPGSWHEWSRREGSE